MVDLSERAEQETYALLDLDGDGTAEKLLLRSRMAQAVNEVDRSEEHTSELQSQR